MTKTQKLEHQPQTQQHERADSRTSHDVPSLSRMLLMFETSIMGSFVAVYECMQLVAKMYVCNPSISILHIALYSLSQNPSQGTMRKCSVSAIPRMMSCPWINLSSRPRILRTFRSGSRASCSSSVGRRSSSGRRSACSCVSVRIACVLLSACETATASGHSAP